MVREKKNCLMEMFMKVILRMDFGKVKEYWWGNSSLNMKENLKKEKWMEKVGNNFLMEIYMKVCFEKISNMVKEK